MTRQPLPPIVGDLGAQVQVLSDEVRTYLMLHGGLLDEHDEAAIERFTEVFLMPAFAAVWLQGYQTWANIESRTVQTCPPVHPREPVNPYASERLARRVQWWHRLLHRRDTPPYDA